MEGLPISYHLRHFTLYFIFGTNLNTNDYWILVLLLGFARNLDSDFIKKKYFFIFFCKNSHIHLD